MDFIAEGSAIRLAEFTPENCAMVEWSFATLEIRPEPLLHAIAGHARRTIAEFAVMDAMNLGWACANLRYDIHIPLMSLIAAHAIPKVDLYDTIALSNTSWAFASLRLRWQPLVSAVSSYAVRRVAEFGLQHLTQVLWSFIMLTMREDAAVVQAQIVDVGLWKAGPASSPHAHALLWSLWRGSDMNGFNTIFEMWSEDYDLESSIGIGVGSTFDGGW